MSFRNTAIFIMASLIVANSMASGAVVDGVKDFATSEDKAEFRNSMMCLAGLMMWPPTHEVLGVDLPMPSFDDVLIAGALTGFILFGMVLVGQKRSWKLAIIIFIVVWLLFKFIGLALIHASGPDCIAMMDDMAEFLKGIYTLTALLGGGALYKVIMTKH